MTLDAFILLFFFQAGLPGYVTSAAIIGSTRDASVIMAPLDDKEMLAASAKARAGLDDFFLKLEDPPPGTSAYAVKIGVADVGDDYIIVRGDHEGYVEYIWVTDMQKTATGFVGIIDNDPENVRNIVSGQHVAFSRDDIFDWSYVERGKIRGNATACPLLRQGPQEELDHQRKQFGLEC